MYVGLRVVFKTVYIDILLGINLSEYYSPVRWVKLSPLAVQFIVNHGIVSLIFQTAATNKDCDKSCVKVLNDKFCTESRRRHLILAELNRFGAPVISA